MSKRRSYAFPRLEDSNIYLMTIGKEVNTQNFRNSYQKTVVNIIYTHNWVIERLKMVFDREGITQQQYNILRILRGAQGPLTTIEIRRRMLDRMSDTSRLVDRLVLKGLVEKKGSDTDRRRVDVTLTNLGHSVLSTMEQYEAEMDDIVSHLTDEEHEQLNILLDKLRKGD